MRLAPWLVAASVAGSSVSAFAQEPAAKADAKAAPAPAADAHEAPARQRYQWGAYLGVHFFDDHNGLGRNDLAGPGSDIRNGVPLGGRFTWHFHDWFAAEAELELLPTGTRNDLADLTQVGYRAHGLVFFVPAGERVRPFALVGGGGRSQLSSDEVIIGNGTTFTIDGGLGVMAGLGPRWGVRLDLRLGIGPDQVGTIASTDVELLFGAYFPIGGKGAIWSWSTETSGRVKVVRPSEDGDDPLEDDDDGDGVAGDADVCPDEAEDMDGNVDDDGCPEREEDVDGDGDGVLGSLDLCPKEKETVNGFDDDDGCPDKVDAKTMEFTGTVEGITFKTGSATIAKKSHAVLDRAAQLLTDDPKLRLTVIGHTDDRGKRARNVKLSLRRAEAVKKYLVRRGISADRIDAMGKGPDEPLYDNRSADGRAGNRRIEFQLTRDK